MGASRQARGRNGVRHKARARPRKAAQHLKPQTRLTPDFGALGLYVLRRGWKPALARGTLTWAKSLERLAGRRHVADITLPSGVRVSTVFLGLDHAHWGGPPLLFETLEFYPDGRTGAMSRYSTWMQAKLGHEATVREHLAASEAVKRATSYPGSETVNPRS